MLRAELNKCGCFNKLDAALKGGDPYVKHQQGLIQATFSVLGRPGWTADGTNTQPQTKR